MTNSEIIRGYVSYCFNFVPQFHTERGDLPLAIFKLDQVKVEQSVNGMNYISFNLIDNHGVLSSRTDSFFERALNPYGFNDTRTNYIVVRGTISMKTAYVQLVDTFNGRGICSMIPENIQTFDKYVEHLEELGLKEKPKGILKIPAHMMIG
jgi:hypothetical protein